MNAHKIIYYTPAFGWGVFILVMSLLPSSKVPDALISMEDFIIHGGIYWVLTGLFLFGRDQFGFKPVTLRYALGLFTAISSFGWLIEGLQEWSGVRRHFEISDGLANMTGVLLGILIHVVLARVFSTGTASK